SSMVTPFSQASFGVTSLPGSVSSGKVVFKAINDFGGNIDGSATF
ncbi:fimbrial chaperone, partial [Escherichia coli]